MVKKPGIYSLYILDKKHVADTILLAYSARNSEVIHAGIYYPPESLKTRLCIQGNRELYEMLGRAQLPHNKIGKLVVAQSPEQSEYLENLHRKASNLGVETQMLTGDQVMQMEPHVKAYAGLLSPSTGIIDSHAYMDYLQQQIIGNGGDVGLDMAVTDIQSADDKGYLLRVTSSSSNDDTVVLARRVFNAAGLHADKVSNMLIPNQYKLYYARGCYYSYTGPIRVNHLIYPCPAKNLAGLGTHLTVDMAGKIKFGPDVTYIDSPYDYNVPEDENQKRVFVDAVQSFMPAITYDKLHPDYSGIRYVLLLHKSMMSCVDIYACIDPNWQVQANLLETLRYVKRRNMAIITFSRSSGSRALV